MSKGTWSYKPTGLNPKPLSEIGEAMQSQCAMKKRLPNEATAALVARRMRASGYLHARYYRCNFCGTFHATSKPDWSRKPKGNRQ